MNHQQRTPAAIRERGGQRPQWRSAFSALRHPNFRLLWTSTLFVSGGNWVQQVTLGWLAFHLSGSALQVSVVLGLRAIPLLLAPVAGVLADRFDRRKVLLIDQAFLAMLAVGFALVVLADIVQMWHLYLFSLLTGIGWSINNPTRQTLVSNAVPRESLMNAVALNSMAFNTTRIFGPAAGGFLITFFGPGVNFLLQAFFYVGVMALIIPFRAEYASGERASRDVSILHNLREGFAYVTSDRTTLTVILVALVPTLTMMSSTMTLMPVYAVEVLGQARDEGNELGLLLTGAGIGGFLGTLLMAMFSQVRAKGRLILAALTIGGLGIIVFSQLDTLAAAMGALVVVQAALMVNMTTNNTVLQMITPDWMRGRVMGVYMMDIGMMPLGGVVAGLVADSFGVQTALWASASIGLAAVAIVAALNPGFRRLRV